MSLETWQPLQFSVRVASYQAYALKILASESSHSLRSIAELPLDTRLDERFGITRDARINIKIRLRLAFAATMLGKTYAFPETLRDLISDLVPPT